MTSDDRVLPGELSGLLANIREGETGAWERLVERVYPEMQALAHREMQREGSGHVLQTTALVHEAWVKLVLDPSERLESRAHFFAAAARAMRRVLVDEARRRRALKRGGGGRALTISGLFDVLPASSRERDEAEHVEVVHTALAAFETHAAHRDKARLVELRFFAGLTNEAAAEVLGVSLATVKRDWEFARTWLRREMERASC